MFTKMLDPVELRLFHSAQYVGIVYLCMYIYIYMYVYIYCDGLRVWIPMHC
jgi:hypothetical protein